ncbi:hypothetical protein BGZ95_001859 [Linnemannia exigua]|uniref:Uncharacterized protein n=1 Tax=Linnemannia exigua TaxID=604196 RepID=A0AAD4D6A3_9FUNG|nr:hypothetical protein BGZ95_001859 [Linnemannia exigua]
MATKKYKNPAKQRSQHLPSQDDPHNQGTFPSSSILTSMINTTHTKHISNFVTIPNPNQFLEGIHNSPEEYSQTFELDLTAAEKDSNGGNEVLPSEMLSWARISHAVKLRVVFEDEAGQKPLVVKAPLKVAFIYSTESINLVSGRPLIEAQVDREEGAVEGSRWMVAESTPAYELELEMFKANKAERRMRCQTQ